MNRERSGNLDALIKRKVGFMVVGFLIVSLFLPMVTSVGEAPSTHAQEDIEEEELQEAIDQELGIQGRLSSVKEIEPADIWHTEVPQEDYGKGPFNTDTATVHLNVTGGGDGDEAPFDWVFSIDSSGSMKDNDPERYRVSGAQLFVDLIEENYSKVESRPRGSTIDFNESARKHHELTDDYDRIRSDLEEVGQRGGTNFHDPLEEALNEFSQNGRGDDGDDGANWYHLFLTDGAQGEDFPDYWPLVEEHANRSIPIFPIGFGGAEEGVLQDMADRTGGQYYYLGGSENLEDVFVDVFEDIQSNTSTVAAESPPKKAMIREVLPPHLEYVEGSVEIETNTPALDVEMTIEEEKKKTILKFEPDRDGEKILNIRDKIDIKYDVGAKSYSHELSITAYGDEGEPLSRISYKNVTSGKIEDIPTEGPRLGVHGPPDPVIGASRWEGVKVGEPVTFKNMSWDGEEKSSWPGDCEIERYEWEFSDGTEVEGTEVEHTFASSGTYDVDLTATTVDNVSATVTETISVESSDPPNFEVDIGSPEDGNEYDIGETVTVEYSVTNTGDFDATQTVEFKVDGVLEAEEDVTLGGGETYESEFVWKTEYPGEYIFNVTSEDDDVKVTVTFIEEYELTIEAEEGGVTDPEPGSYVYPEGEDVTVEATADEGWEFVEWTGDETGTDPTIEINMDENKSVTAVFEEEPLEEYNLTIEVEGQGTTDPEPGEHTYEAGSDVAVEATPAEGWEFDMWTGDNESAEKEITITMDQDKAIMTHFKEEGPPEEYELAINIDGEGSTEPENGTHTYEDGAEVTITASADEGWYFAGWTGTDETGEEITIMMEEDKEVTAVFEELVANFEVEIIDYDDEVEEDGRITVRIRVRNTGSGQGTQDIEFMLDGEREKVYSDLTLGPGDEYEGEFTLEEKEAGEHEIEVASSDTSHGVLVMAEEKGETGYEGESFLSNYWWLILPVVIAVAIIALLFVMRGKSKKETIDDTS